MHSKPDLKIDSSLHNSFRIIVIIVIIKNGRWGVLLIATVYLKAARPVLARPDPEPSQFHDGSASVKRERETEEQGTTWIFLCLLLDLVPLSLARSARRPEN